MALLFSKDYSVGILVGSSFGVGDDDLNGGVVTRTTTLTLKTFIVGLVVVILCHLIVGNIHP